MCADTYSFCKFVLKINLKLKKINRFSQRVRVVQTNTHTHTLEKIF